MRNKKFSKIISLVVLSLFLVNNIAYGLSPMPGSRNPATQDDMYALGRKLFADKRGPGAIDIDAITPAFTGAEFVGDELLTSSSGRVYIDDYGAEFIKADYENLPEAWKNNPILKETDLVSAFKAFRDTEARIPAAVLDIKEGYFPVDEEKGELPIARIEKVGADKYVLVLHTKFVRMWNHIRQNDVWFEANLGPNERRTVSVAWGLFYWIAKHEMTDLQKKNLMPKSVGHIRYDIYGETPQEALKINREEVLANMIGGNYRLMTDAIRLWFLGSYAFRNTSRYNNETFLKRLNWIFKSDAAREMGLHLEFPQLLPDTNKRTIAIAFAYAINYNFFNRPGIAVADRHVINPEFFTEYEERERAREAAGIVKEAIYTGGREKPAAETKKTTEDAAAQGLSSTEADTRTSDASRISAFNYQLSPVDASRETLTTAASAGLETVVTSPEKFPEVTAQKVADKIRMLQRVPEKQVVMVFATGNTMIGFLNNLAKEENIDWTRVQAFHLNEYKGLPPEDEHSFAYFLNQNLFSRIPLPRENIYYINGANPNLEAYMATLRSFGGADIVLLGVGMDGHLAFNEPPDYSSFNSRMQEVRLVQSTIEANKEDYPGIVDSPYAYTMGMADIFEGRHLFFFANKAKKADIVRKSLEGLIAEEIPASMIQRHPQVTVVLDNDAASLLSSSKTVTVLEQGAVKSAESIPATDGKVFGMNEGPGAETPIPLSTTDLKIITRILEKDVIDMIYKAGSGHPGGSLSMLRIIAALYFGKTRDGKRVMRYDPKDPNWINRDRLVLSKGHAAPGLYAALGRAGFFPVSEFDTLRQLGSRLQGHPDMTKTPGVDMSTGSLGVGLSAAVGMALAGKMDGRDYTVNVILGDGEVQEGQVDEAARHASIMGLDNILAFLDWNGMQIDGRVTAVDLDYGGQRALWQSRGWNVIAANGNNMQDVVEAIEQAKMNRTGSPTIIITYTKKGANLPGMEKHGAAPKEAEVKAATEIIEKDLSVLWGEGFNKDAFINALLSKIALNRNEKRGIDKKNDASTQVRKDNLLSAMLDDKAQSLVSEARKPYSHDKKVATRTANGDELVLLGAEDPDVVVMSADLKGSVMFDKFEKAFGTFSITNPKGRYIPIGIREAHMASLAAGLAACGKIPVVGTFSIFTTRMTDQLNAVLNTNLPIVIVGTHGGLATGPDGRTHQDAHSQSVLGSLPGVKLLEGADAEETRVLTRHIYDTAKREGGIYYIRPARLDTPILSKPEGWQEGVRKGFYTLFDSEAGKPGQTGRYDVVIASTGVVAVDAVEAAKELALTGKSVRVVNVSQLTEITSPKNAAEFAALINCESLVTVIDALPEILADRVNRVLVARGIKPILVSGLGINRYGESGKPAELYALHGLDKNGIYWAALTPAKSMQAGGGKLFGKEGPGSEGEKETRETQQAPAQETGESLIPIDQESLQSWLKRQSINAVIEVSQAERKPWRLESRISSMIMNRPDTVGFSVEFRYRIQPRLSRLQMREFIRSILTEAWGIRPIEVLVEQGVNAASGRWMMKKTELPAQPMAETPESPDGPMSATGGKPFGADIGPGVEGERGAASEVGVINANIKELEAKIKRVEAQRQAELKVSSELRDELDGIDALIKVYREEIEKKSQTASSASKQGAKRSLLDRQIRETEAVITNAEMRREKTSGKLKGTDESIVKIDANIAKYRKQIEGFKKRIQELSEQQARLPESGGLAPMQATGGKQFGADKGPGVERERSAAVETTPEAPVYGAGNSFLMNMRKRLERVAGILKLTKANRAKLLALYDVYTSTLKTKLDDGSEEEIFTVRVKDKIKIGKDQYDVPAKGGVRFILPINLGKEFYKRLNEWNEEGLSLQDIRVRAREWVVEETKALAAGMTLKDSLVGLPLGGGKGTVTLFKIEEEGGRAVVRPLKEGNLSDSELAYVSRTVSRDWMKAGVVGPELDVPAPDVNTNSKIMAWIVDEIIEVMLEDTESYLWQKLPELAVGLRILDDDLIKTPYLEYTVRWLKHHPDKKFPWLGTYTGKPLGLAGSEVRDKATALGTKIAAKEIAKKVFKKDSLDGLTVAIQGFGNAGQHAARLFAKEGARIVAVSDSEGAIYKKGGFSEDDLQELYRLKEKTKVVDGRQKNKSVCDFSGEGITGVEKIKNEDLLELDVQMLIPAALENVITAENADRIKAPIILEAANGPTTIEADEILRRKGAYVVSDSLASAGGVIVSYLEMLQNFENRYYSAEEIEKKLEKILATNFEKIWDIHERFKVDLRTAGDILSVSRIFGIDLKKVEQSETAAEAPAQPRTYDMPPLPVSDETTEHPLIAIISEFVVPLGRDVGPGSIKLSRDEIQNIWQIVNLLNNNQIEILLPQRVKLTETMKKALSDIRKRKGEGVVRCEEYADGDHLKKLLGQKMPPEVNRIILTEQNISSEIQRLVEAEPELFSGIRLLNIALPDSYMTMNAKEKTFYQARMVMTAILARLYERDRTPMVELILANMLKGCVNVDASGISGFLSRLAESEDEAIDINRIKERILYCLGRTVSIMMKLAEDMERVRLIMKEFWTAA